MSWTTEDFKQTQTLGKQLSLSLKRGDVLALCGDLGSGKTTFVQGVAVGLGVDETVTSPSFVLAHEYSGKELTIYHLDLFRLEKEEDVETIGIEDYMAPDGVTLVEWADKIPEILPADYVKLQFETKSDQLRIVTATPHGERAKQIVKAWGV